MTNTAWEVAATTTVERNTPGTLARSFDILRRDPVTNGTFAGILASASDSSYVLFLF